MCSGNFGCPGGPGAVGTLPFLACSLMVRVKRGILSPPATGTSCSSGTPALRRRFIASQLAMTMAPVRMAIRSAPGRLDKLDLQSYLEKNVLVKVCMRYEDVIDVFDIVYGKISG